MRPVPDAVWRRRRPILDVMRRLTELGWLTGNVGVGKPQSAVTWIQTGSRSPREVGLEKSPIPVGARRKWWRTARAVPFLNKNRGLGTPGTAVIRLL